MFHPKPLFACNFHYLRCVLNIIPTVNTITSLVIEKSVMKITGYPLHRENKGNGEKKILVRENTGNLEMLPKHRERARN